MTYQKLNQGLVQAIQNGQVGDFIEQLNQTLADYPADYISWLVIARAYEAKGDIEKASNSYEQLIRISDPNHLNTSRLIDEVSIFITKHKRDDLLKSLETKFGTNYKETRDTKKQVNTNDNLSQARQEHQKQTKLANGNQGKGNSTKPTSKVIADKIHENLAQAHKAFQKGELDSALIFFQNAHELGDNSSRTFLMIAQTLQRLKRFQDAQTYLDKGIRLVQGEQRLGLLNLRAQIYSAQNEWTKALAAYDKLLQHEQRPAVRRFSKLQQVNILRRLGELDKAKVILNEILNDYPQDQVTLSILAAIDRLQQAPVEDLDAAKSIDSDELQVDVSDEGIALISPMLRRDLAIAEFRDEKILRQGGHPEVSDADRLLGKAEQTKNSEFGERYPEFLEAAKAYNELPEGTYYELERFYSSLARYAMLKGGALVSELRRRVYSNQVDLTDLRRLRDSASSYYLESLSLQVRLDVNYALIPLTNLLRAQLASVLTTIGEELPSDLFQLNFSRLFKYCHEHSNDEVTRVAYESVIALGAASGFVWNRLQQLSGGPGILGLMLDTPSKRGRPYQIISQMTNRQIDVNQRPGEVLKQAFLIRRAMSQDVLNFLHNQQQNPFSIENVGSLSSYWQSFPHAGILSDTDHEILNGINALIATISPYQIRSPEERTGILFTVRTNIESLLKLIHNSPTYWGRVGFEPLLLRWQASLRGIERRRLSDIQPELSVKLEPPVFYPKGDNIESSIVIQNIGRATAEGAILRVILSSDGTHDIIKNEERTITEEIPTGDTYYLPLSFVTQELTHGIDKPYHIKLQISPIFHQHALDFEEQEFTLEVLKDSSITLDEIPWDEVKIPPKHLFKGRENFIIKLAKHLESGERNKTYILYGLTRTGKSSILNYLSQHIDLQEVNLKNKSFRFVTFEWHMGKANAESSAHDMWNYLLEQSVVGKIERLADGGLVNPNAVPALRHPGNARFRDWEPILDHLKQFSLYPVFLLDEFSYFRSLVNSRRIDASFLAAIRQFAIDEKSSFIFAGTYDLRKLVQDPAYGITGQLVNAIETKVSFIDRGPAIELIQAMSPKLRFTDDAVEHILRLSHRIPYFIQLLCKNCAKYAVTAQRAILGFPEVEAVTLALTGSERASRQLGIPPMAPGVFMNNMQTPTDPPEFGALISTICHLTPGLLQSRKVTYPEIQAMWDKNKVRLFQAKLANSIRELLDREVLVESDDEGIPAYEISVDLFRRWWTNEHRNIRLELDALKEDG